MIDDSSERAKVRVVFGDNFDKFDPPPMFGETDTNHEKIHQVVRV